MISTEFQERYAKYLLYEIAQDKYFNLKNGERPDILSKDNIIGVEVTNALPQEWAELDSILGEYLGKGLTYDEIMEETKKKNIYSHIFPVNNGKNWGYHKHKDSVFDFKYFLDAVEKIIKKKFLKSENYASCEQMELFIFLDLCCITELDIEKIWRNIDVDWSGFDTIIFYNSAEMFFLASNGDVKCEEVNADMRKRAFGSARIEMMNKKNQGSNFSD